ncbi:MAG TPA: SIMPL domain-containing protein [Acidimicrobiia bacterium]|jgi:uncharacterized protein YggE
MSESNGITVTGSGTVTAAPDTATVDLGVSVLAPTATEAAGAAAHAATELVEALTSSGIDRADISTSRYSLAAEYDWTESGRRDLGYRAQNTVRARLKDLSTVGAVIDAVVAAAGDTVTVNGLEFSVADRVAALAEARAAAWADVMARAGQLAELAGVALGRPVEVVESEGWTPPPSPKMLRMEAASVTPVEPGTLEVTATIRARFRID